MKKQHRPWSEHDITVALGEKIPVHEQLGRSWVGHQISTPKKKFRAILYTLIAVLSITLLIEMWSIHQIKASEEIRQVRHNIQLANLRIK